MASKSKTKQVCHASIRVFHMTAHEVPNAAEIVNIAWALNCLEWKDNQAGWQFPILPGDGDVSSDPGMMY